eukprot:8430535-Lingulodinium_polyedra.AAC.1
MLATPPQSPEGAGPPADGGDAVVVAPILQGSPTPVVSPGSGAEAGADLGAIAPADTGDLGDECVED